MGRAARVFSVKMDTRRPASSSVVWLVTVLVVIMWLTMSGAQAQLTFSTQWGKRQTHTTATSPDNAILSSSPCHTTLDSLIVIHKLIQGEAQKLLECEKR